MYVTNKDLETISELSAFVDGALESADDVEYWSDLSKRTSDLQKRMKEANFKQCVKNQLRKPSK